METIARRLRVSKVTVSNAMRGSGRISAETRARVLAMAGQLGYRPNPLVTALMSNLRRKRSSRRCTLAFVTCFPQRDEWCSHPTFVQFQAGAERRATELGYRLETHWSGEVEHNSRRLSTILYARGIPGLVLAPLPANGIGIELDWSHFSTVAIGHTFTGFHAHRVSNHQFHSIKLAMDELVARGYRRIGLIMPAMDDNKVENIWSAGFIAARQRHRLPSIAPIVLPRFEAATAVPWIKRKRLDAVVSTNHHMLRHMRGIGIDVPGEAGFVHLDWSAEKGEMAGVNQRSDQIGAAAIDLLIEQLNNNEAGIPLLPKTVMIDGCWHEGPSLRPRETAF
ncbi:LacI family transcriptional regulator [Opitutaceae bacterium TAV5]|nr:LacI family transcriptional regulator [Opitutaceae bacterium TAV5]